MRRDSRPDRTVRLSGISGIIAPIVLTTVTATVSFLTPGYNQLSQFISELGETGAPFSTTQNVAFALYGMLVVVFSTGLGKSIGRDKVSRIGTILLVVAGIGDVGAAIFHCDPGCPSSGSSSNVLHGQFSSLSIIPAILAISVFSLPFGKDVRWRGFRSYSLATAVLATVFYLLAGFIGPSSLRGGFQRLRLGTMLVWIEVTASKLLRLVLHAIPMETGSSKARGIQTATQRPEPGMRPKTD